MRISITLGSKFTRGRKECEVCTLLGVSLPTSKSPFYTKRKENILCKREKKINIKVNEVFFRSKSIELIF